jgi:hypothetical protein
MLALEGSEYIYGKLQTNFLKTGVIGVLAAALAGSRENITTIEELYEDFSC